MMHSTKKKFDDAIEYYSTCADLSRKSGNQTVLAEALNNISSVYQQSGNYDKSIKVAEQVLAVPNPTE
jgi:tetratricopeptide (TPR) repeat protein